MAFTKIAAAGIGSTGIVTLQNLIVTGSLNTPIITGAASTENVRTNNLIVSGVTTSSGGFVGDLTGNATGLSGTPNITVGVITASNAFFSGNISIAGTVTYDDVTNVDSIGIITARTGVRITDGGLVVTSGVSTFTSGPVLVGSGTSTGTASQTLQVTGGGYVSGNLGIGTTNPGSTLDVRGGNISVSGGLVNISRGDVTYAKISINNASTANDTNGDTIISGYYPIIFKTDLGLERVRIDRNGNLGIGTNNPNNLLSIVGNSATLAGSSIRINSTANQQSSNSGLWITANQSTSHYNWLIGSQYNVSAAFEITPSTAVNGATFSTPAFLVLASGNVGIGTIPKSWSFPTLQIGNSAAIFGNSNSSSSFVCNTYYDGTNYRYINTGTASRLSQTSGTFTFQSASSGNAGDITNLSSIFQVTSSGNVLVGTTTATGTASQLLQVTGGGYVSGSVGIATTNPQYTLHVNGSFAATTKSFVIPHPSKPNYKLRYACLEGPENSVYVRGRTTEHVIELPEYWVNLVDENSITVNLTPIGNKTVWVEEINNNKVYINSEDTIDCFYTVFAERKDVEKLVVEVEEN